MIFSHACRRFRSALFGSLALLAPCAVPAQIPLPQSNWQIGLHTDAVISTPTASFTGLPGIPNCLGLVSDAAFTDGNGWGFSVGGVAGLKRFGIGGAVGGLGGYVRFGFATLGTTFETTEMIGQARDRSGTLIPVVSRYTISTRRSELRLEPMLSYRFGTGGEYIVSAGVRAGYLLAGTYEQREGIASPDNAVYADGSRQRNESSGDLRELSPVQIGLSAGISYEIPFSEVLVLRPELGGSLGITSPVAGTGWRPHELRAGISLLYSPPGEQSSPLQQED